MNSHSPTWRRWRRCDYLLNWFRFKCRSIVNFRIIFMFEDFFWYVFFLHSDTFPLSWWNDLTYASNFFSRMDISAGFNVYTVFFSFSVINHQDGIILTTTFTII